MHTTIFCFSGTGNCLKLARDLAAEIGDAHVVPIAKAFKEPAVTFSGRAGFVFPVYAVSVPLIVSEFVDKLRAESPAYLFAVTTCGGVSGDPLGQLAGRLKKRALTLSAGFVIQMPNNYTPLGGALSREAQERMFAKAARRVKEIAAMVKENRPAPIERSRLPLSLLGAVISPIAVRVMRGEDKKFWVSEACTACGLCEKVCPVGNIRMVDKRPVWAHRCEQCFACLQWCPAQAIQCGRHTVGRERYHHPSVTVQDILDMK